MALSPQYEELLSPLARELAEVIGLPALAALVAWQWGRYHVPQKLPADPQHPLRARLGDAAAAALIERFCGERIDIPRCAAVLRAARDADIRAARRGGLSEAQAAERWRLSASSIRQICARDSEADQRQLGLW